MTPASPSRLRIGILVDSPTVPAWVARIVTDIQQSDCARLELIVVNAAPPRPTDRSLRGRARELWRRGLYNRWRLWDQRRQPRGAPDAFAAVALDSVAGGVAQLAAVPERTRFSDRFAAGDLDAIREAKLDVLFRFGFRILRGDILTAARCGVWSFHHGDNREYRGSAAGFWELYERNPVTGSILQQLTESLDAGRVLYRSWSATEPLSQQATLNPMYWKSAAFAIRRLRDLHRHGWEYLQSLPDFREPDHYRKPLYHVPAAPVMARFLARQGALRLRGRLRGLGGAERRNWFIAYRRRPAGGPPVWVDSGGFRVLPQPEGRFYADPFLFQHQGRTLLFFEDFDYAAGRAHISYVELGPEGPRGEPRIALAQDCHLSYPFVFEAGGEIYLIPETRQRRRIELYRARRFPGEWEREAILREGIEAVDATVLRHAGRFWLFANVAAPGASPHDELHLFFADRITGPWREHPANPIISDVRRSRPAGALFEHEGMLIRPSQDCSGRYGRAIQFNQVEELSETAYRERTLASLDASWAAGNLCTHTFNRSGQYEVIDGMRMQRPQAMRPSGPAAQTEMEPAGAVTE